MEPNSPVGWEVFWTPNKLGADVNPSFCPFGVWIDDEGEGWFEGLSCFDFYPPNRLPEGLSPPKSEPDGLFESFSPPNNGPRGLWDF